MRLPVIRNGGKASVPALSIRQAHPLIRHLAGELPVGHPSLRLRFAFESRHRIGRVARLDDFDGVVTFALRQDAERYLCHVQSMPQTPWPWHTHEHICGGISL